MNRLISPAAVTVFATATASGAAAEQLSGVPPVGALAPSPLDRRRAPDECSTGSIEEGFAEDDPARRRSTGASRLVC